MSMFNYAPIVWMLCNKTLYAEITKVHKRALRSVLCDFGNSYEVMSENSNFKSIHEIHLLFLLCQVFSELLDPDFMQLIFKPKTVPYNLRNRDLMCLPSASSQRVGTESFVFRGSLLWNYVQQSVKSKSTLPTFKYALKSLKISNICTCRIYSQELYSACAFSLFTFSLLVSI